MKREVHKITVPYLIRFSWATGEAKRQWQERLDEARAFLQRTLPQLIVDNGLAEFAPIIPLEGEKFIRIAEAFVTTHYPNRWTTHEESKQYMGNKPTFVQVYGTPDQGMDLYYRWDIYRDIWQEALAPDCCKKAYQKSQYNDPYHDLYDELPGKIKKIPTGNMNPLLAPIGFYLSPIVPCSFDCEHAHKKSQEIEDLIKSTNPSIHETLKTVTEMPVRIDSYRGIALVDTPMFKALYTTDAYKDKYVLDAKVKDTELFSYELDWVAKGSRFPFKGIFSTV